MADRWDPRIDAADGALILAEAMERGAGAADLGAAATDTGAAAGAAAAGIAGGVI